MRRIPVVVPACLFAAMLVIGQAAPQQPQPQPAEQPAPPAQPLPSQQQAAPQPQTQPPPQMGGQQTQVQQPGQTAQQQPAAGRASPASGIPLMWVVVGLGVLVILLIVLLSTRISGGVERVEHIERHEHH